MKKLWICILIIVLIMTCFVSCATVKPNDVAQILIDHEEELKEEIRKLNEENPRCEYYYHPVGKVYCIYHLESNVSPDAIVEKYDMSNTFAAAGISTLKYSEQICIAFDRDDFTEAMHQKFKQIKDEEALITDLDIRFETFFATSYMPKIDYYAKDVIELDYEQIESIWNKDDNQGFILKSKKEYDDYLNGLLETIEDKYLKAQINSQIDLYDASFFKENALILTKMIIRGSGSEDLTVNNLYISENKVYVVVRTDVPTMCTDDMQYTSFTLAVSQSEVIHVNEVVTLE